MWAGASNRMTNVFARQLLGQRSAGRLLLLACFLDVRRDDRRGGGQSLGLVGRQTLDRQLELLDLARQLLRRAPKLGPPVARQLELQFGNLDFRISEDGGVVCAQFLFWENSHWHDDGGCKDYRTQAIERDCIKRMRQTYPGLVRVAPRRGNAWAIEIDAR
jgi:hypothetical protein